MLGCEKALVLWAENPSGQAARERNVRQSGARSRHFLIFNQGDSWIMLSLFAVRSATGIGRKLAGALKRKVR